MLKNSIYIKGINVLIVLALIFTFIPITAISAPAFPAYTEEESALTTLESEFAPTSKAATTHNVTINTSPATASIIVLDSSGKVCGTGAELNLPDGEYTYHAGLDGYVSVRGSFSIDGSNLTFSVGLNPYNETDYSWTKSYRGDASNMAIINDPTIAANVATNLDNAELKWAVNIGGSWLTPPTGTIFVDGYLYAVYTSSIIKINANTGEKVASATLDASKGSTYFLTSAEGMIFVQTGLRIEARYASDLSQAWRSKSVGANSTPGNQGLVQIYYDDGFIYGGTTKGSFGSAETGGVFFCMSAADGSIIWEIPWARNNNAYASADSQSSAGYYWAGPNVIGDYAVIGSDSGVVLSVNKLTGVVADTYKLNPASDIRSAVAYDEGFIYFSTKTGNVHKIVFNESDGKFGAAFSNKIAPGATESIGTPVVYNGRLYVSATVSGGGAIVGILNADDLSQIYSVPLGNGTNAQKGQDVLLIVDDANNCVYGYTTYYNTPGSITAFTDAPGQTTPKYSDFRSLTVAGTQYCAAQLIVGPDGTLYFTNDSGYLFAISKIPAAHLTSLSANPGVFDKGFSPGERDYELVVSRDIQNVSLSLTASAGTSVRINGTENTSGIVSLILTNDITPVVISLTNGDVFSEYTVNVRKASSDASLAEAYVYLSNTAPHLYTGADNIDLTLNTSTDYFSVSHATNASTFRRLWFKPQPNTTVKATAISGVSRIDTATPSADYSRYNVYFANGYGNAVVMLTVTAEDGITTRDYFFSMTAADKEYDNYPAVISAVNSDRISVSAGSVTILSSQPGSYYFEVVAQGAAEPTIDTSGSGTAFSNIGYVMIPLSALSSGAKDVYIAVKNANGDVSEKLLVSLPGELKSTTVNLRIEGSSVNLYYSNLTMPETANDVTVFDLLEYLDSLNTGIDITFKDSGFGCYVSAINGEAEGHFEEENIYDGWQYVVNGESPVVGISEYTIKNNDSIVVYYANYDALYPIVGTANLNSSGTITFTANVTTYDETWEPSTALQPIVGAEVTWYYGQISEKYITDTTGSITISPSNLTNGQHRMQIEKFTESGRMEVIRLAPDHSVTVSGQNPGTDPDPEPGPVDPGIPSSNITVTFCLLGDDVHGEDGELHGLKAGNLITWISARSVTIPAGSTVGTVFTRVLNANGYTYVGFSGNYISSITKPGGPTLAEFTNGPDSGWMYTVNGVHPIVPLNDCVLYDGDEIVWHYTDVWVDDSPYLQKPPGQDNTGTGGSNVTNDLDDDETALSQAPWSDQFTDVKSGDWYYDAVKYAFENGLMNGTSATTFSPNTAATRAMLVTVLYRYEGEPAVTAANIFSDAADGQWYTNAIIWAAENGIVEGYGNGRFGTNDNITREQVATILMRYAEWKEVDISSAADLDSYSDAPQISPWAQGAMKWAVGADLINGRSAAQLAPKGTTTRAEVATLLLRLFENILK